MYVLIIVSFWSPTGIMNVTARCVKNLNEEVNESSCDHDKRPQTGILPCNEQPCPPR